MDSSAVMKLLAIWILVVSCVVDAAPTADEGIKVLLVGDSTTIGNLSRELNPEGPHLEQMIVQLMALEKGVPPVTVINTGHGGETAKRLLGSKNYANEIAPVEDVDYIFVRLGINDWFKCDDFAADFPGQLKALIGQLRQDHPGAVIIASTICRFMPHEDCVKVNKLIKQVAEGEQLPLFDLYTPYHEYLMERGEDTLNVRRCPLDKIPEKYHEWLKPRTFPYWKDGKPEVRVDDLSLDPLFGHLKEWYYDRHPNSAGYNLIAVETVRYLAPVLRALEAD